MSRTRAATIFNRPGARLVLLTGALLVIAACSHSSSAVGSRAGPPAKARVAQQAGTAVVSQQIGRAAAARPAQPGLPPVVFTAASGATATLYVEIADTPELQELGLMNRPSMPDDRGMIFIFTRENTTPFWMENTLIDLSIAFIDAGGVIVDIQEMKAETLDNHFPAAPYQYAIEANAGWYARNGINPGDSADVSQAVAASPVFGSGTPAPADTPTP